MKKLSLAYSNFKLLLVKAILSVSLSPTRKTVLFINNEIKKDFFNH